MEIVIKVPDEEYKRMKEKSMFGRVNVWKEAIKNGKVLPKGHGDLKAVGDIHLDKFIRIENFSLNPRFSEEFKKGYNSAIDDALYVLMSAPVLIEADKEVDE